MKKVVKAVLIVLATICFALSAYYDVELFGITAGGLLFCWVPFGIVPGGFGVLALRGLLLVLGIVLVIIALVAGRVNKKNKGVVKMKALKVSKAKKVKAPKAKKVRGKKGNKNVIVTPAVAPVVAPAVKQPEVKKTNTAIKF